MNAVNGERAVGLSNLPIGATRGVSERSEVLATFFHGLADPNRMRILELLADRPRTVTELVLEGGRCTGVVTADGERYLARKAVLSTIHVKRLVEMASGADEFTLPRLAQLFVASMAAVQGGAAGGGPAGDAAADGSAADGSAADGSAPGQAGPAAESGLALDRRAFCLRKRAQHEAGLYFASLSSRTIVYKGMLTALQLEPFYPDLTDPAYTSALALVHSRFSTNTFPSWELAHPYRFIAHNGEINTVRGNRNWMRAREAMLASDLIPASADGRGIERLLPILEETASDSASFDECLELLHLGGRSLPHAILMMIPEPWENHEEMDADRRAFYQFHSTLMEPWDGPACVAFTDGTLIGAVLDRNGLRPSRYWVTHDGLVILASEVGVLDIDPANVVRKGRLQPGRIFLADTASRRILEDADVKAALAAEHPYQDWLHAGLMHLDDLPDRERDLPASEELITMHRLAGYTEEELRVLLAPMARAGAEPVGSMGTDTPIAVLSDRSRLIFDYFTQLFAQVTNPPLDAIREELVTSLSSSTGPEQNLLEPGPAACRQIVLPYPVISDNDLAKIIHINDDGDLPGFAAHVADGRFAVAGGGTALRERLAEICREVSEAIAGGARIIVLSDRGTVGGEDGWDRSLAPIPSLLLTGAVHHHLIRERTRTQAGLVVECGDAREAHHIALLTGFGAAAVNPYLALETVQDMVRRGELENLSASKAAGNLIKALGKGVLKVMSKMGVSTIASYTGAQIFEAVGLKQEFVDSYFTWTPSRIGGVGLGAGDAVGEVEDTLLIALVQRRERARVPGRGAPRQARLIGGGRRRRDRCADAAVPRHGGSLHAQRRGRRRDAQPAAPALSRRSAPDGPEAAEAGGEGSRSLKPSRWSAESFSMRSGARGRQPLQIVIGVLVLGVLALALAAQVALLVTDLAGGAAPPPAAPAVAPRRVGCGRSGGAADGRARGGEEGPRLGRRRADVAQHDLAVRHRRRQQLVDGAGELREVDRERGVRDALRQQREHDQARHDEGPVRHAVDGLDARSDRRTEHDEVQPGRDDGRSDALHQRAPRACHFEFIDGENAAIIHCAPTSWIKISSRLLWRLSMCLGRMSLAFRSSSSTEASCMSRSSLYV